MRDLQNRIAQLERKAEDAEVPESVPVFFLPADNEAQRQRQEAEIAELERNGRRYIAFTVIDAREG